MDSETSQIGDQSREPGESFPALGPSSATRRTFLRVSGGILGATTLGLSGCGAKPRWAPHRFYEYRVSVEVDGQRYDLTNGGILATDLQKTEGTSEYDLPMPAAAALPTGETLVVFPPGLGSAWEIARRRVQPGQRLEGLPYSASAFPSVFIFDDASKPNRVLGWITRAGVTSSKTRVKLVSVENRIVTNDTRASIIKLLPWYEPTERAYLKYTSDQPAAVKKYRQENESLFEQGGDTFAPAHSLYSWVATVSSKKSGEQGLKLDGAYATLGAELSNGRYAQFPLRKIGNGAQAKLGWSEDPLTFEFAPFSDADKEWAADVSPRHVFGLKHVFAVERYAPLEALQTRKFVRKEPGSYVLQSDDGGLEIRLGHARLALFRSAVQENTIIGGSDFGIG